MEHGRPVERKDIRCCDKCGGKLSICFYIVTVGQAVVNVLAAQQHMHLEMMMGGGVGGMNLANVLGSNTERLATLVGEDTKLVLCQDCFCMPLHLAELVEVRVRKLEEKKSETSKENE